MNNSTDTRTHTKSTEQSFNEKLLPDKLSDLGLASDLYLSLNYHYVKVPKSGIMAKFKKLKEALDIDIACMLFDKEGNLLDLIWYKNLRDKSEAILHYGDELTGFRQPKERVKKNESNKTEIPNKQTQSKKTSATDSSLSPMDLESIHIALPKLSVDVHHIALVASSFQNIPLNKVPAGQIDLEDVEGNTALHVNLTHLPKDCTSLWLASLIKTQFFVFREDKEYRDWQFVKQEKPLPHASIEDLVKHIQF